jgi:hypothetical protein
MAVKHLGKKGMFLTFISIVIIAAAIIIFTPSDINLNKDIPVIKTRVSNVDEYVLDLENVYLERALRATGRNTIKALIGYVEEQGLFSTITEFENTFSEVLLCGQVGGIVADCTGGTPIGNFIDPTYMDPDIMVGNTYRDWIDRIVITAQDTFNVDTVYGISNIRVYQTRPWFVNVDADLSFNVSSETASWNKTATIKTEIEVEGFDDPYYLANTGGSYVNKIRQSGTKYDEWDIAKVKDFIRDGNYTHFQNSNAPNFLMRFYNDISSSSCCGIESLVNPNNPAISDRDVSYIGYKYWSTTPDCDDNPPIIYLSTETDIESEFNNIKFDTSDLARYKIRDDPLADIQQECPPPE